MEMKARQYLVTFGLALALLIGLLEQAVAEEEDPKASDPNMTVLKIELPEPSFSGTPLDFDLIDVEHFEFSYKPRVPFYVHKEAQLLSSKKLPACSDPKAPAALLKKITDGNKSYEEPCVVTLAAGKQYIQLDLQDRYTLDAILVWRFHEYERVYHDIIVQVSDDPKFPKEKVKTLFNNDYDNSSGMGVGKDKEFMELAEGRLIDPKGAEGRYLRLYSNGNTTDDMNTYIEVEVFGRPIAKEGS